MKKLIYISILFSSISFGQTVMDKGDELYAKYDFDKAIETYNKAIKSKKATPEVNVKIANSYFNMTDYKSALMWYERSISSDFGNVSEVDFLRYVECLKSEGKIGKADEALFSFYAENTDKVKALKDQRASLLDAVDSLYKVRNIDANTPNADFGVAKYNNKIIYSSSRNGEGDLTKKTYNWNGQPYLNIYEAKMNNANGQLNNTALYEGVNTQYHDAMLCFNKDYSRVYFSTNSLKKKQKLATNEEGTSTLQIMLADVVNGKITNIVSLAINSELYSCSHPMLSEDGKFLYFVSNMENGFGETDIYYAPIKPDGTIGKHENAGPTINTAGREMFPTIQNNTLYFSSDGHYGIGGLDLFQSEKTSNNTFQTPMNLGRPFNSEMDDFNMLWTTDKENGYISSNRSGGKGDDDIYYFTKDLKNWRQDVVGEVREEKSKNLIPNALVQVFDEYDSLVTETYSASLGMFKVNVPCNTTHELVFSKENHSKEKLEITTPEKPKKLKEEDQEQVYLTVYEDLVKKEDGVEKIIVEPIYFEYDKSDITQEAKIELQKVITAMETFPNLVIKIESHTDSRGGDKYNLELSDDRAKSTRTYLISKGINKERIISATGYGETRPKNKCKNGVKCSDDEHFINRRSDFIVVKK